MGKPIGATLQMSSVKSFQVVVGSCSDECEAPGSLNRGPAFSTLLVPRYLLTGRHGTVKIGRSRSLTHQLIVGVRSDMVIAIRLAPPAQLSLTRTSRPRQAAATPIELPLVHDA